jgi:hypothetical protein
MPKESLGWGYLVATIMAIAATVFCSWLEWVFVRSWSNQKPMYFPSLVTAVAAVILMGSIVFRSERMLALQTASAATSILMACWFLIEIIPIASGNNDSGEVFPFVALPMVGLFVYACVSYSKLRVFRTNSR